MMPIVAALSMVVGSLYAQSVGGSCQVVECPDQFMPKPSAPTSAADINKVSAAMAQVIAASAREAAAAKSLDALYFTIRNDLRNSYAQLPQWLIDRLVTDQTVMKAALKDSDYIEKQKNLRSAITENYDARNKAILEVASAYHLFPPVRDFTNDPRGAGVNMVAKPWRPQYSRHEKRDENGRWQVRTPEDLAQERLTNAAAGGGVMEARTRGDGTMELYGQAFANPDRLAVAIFHETSHWVDVAGKSGGHTSSDLPYVSFRTEQHAYERAAIFAATLKDGGALHAQLAAKYKMQADIAEIKRLTWGQVLTKYPNWIGTDRKGSLALAPAESELSPGDEALLEKKFEEAGKKAAAREREQTRIVHRDHDARLRDAIISMTRRSCDNPGSVSQMELSALPRPYQKEKDFRWMAPLEPRDLPGREHCVNIYDYLSYSGRNAEELRKASTPTQMPAPIVAVPVPPTTPFVPVEATRKPFSRVLPDFKSYAINACRAPQRIKGDALLFSAYDHSARTFDDALIMDLKNGMDECSRRLFEYLVDANRRYDYDAIRIEAIQAKVRALTPVPPVGGGYSPPSSSEPDCEYDSNIGGRICPKRL